MAITTKQYDETNEFRPVEEDELFYITGGCGGCGIYWGQLKWMPDELPGFTGGMAYNPFGCV